jgi:uncharacterized protein (DUF1330 family)
MGWPDARKVPRVAIVLCVMLWAVPGREDQLTDYEDRVLALLRQHQARVLTRVRALGEGPTEVQILEFASAQALEDFQHDPQRQALSGLRDEAVARTQLIRVEPVVAPE